MPYVAYTPNIERFITDYNRIALNPMPLANQQLYRFKSRLYYDKQIKGSYGVEAKFILGGQS